MFQEFFAMILEEALKGLDARDGADAFYILDGIDELVRTARRHMDADLIPEEVRIV